MLWSLGLAALLIDIGFRIQIRLSANGTEATEGEQKFRKVNSTPIHPDILNRIPDHEMEELANASETKDVFFLGDKEMSNNILQKVLSKVRDGPSKPGKDKGDIFKMENFKRDNLIRQGRRMPSGGESPSDAAAGRNFGGIEEKHGSHDDVEDDDDNDEIYDDDEDDEHEWLKTKNTAAPHHLKGDDEDRR